MLMCVSVCVHVFTYVCVSIQVIFQRNQDDIRKILYLEAILEIFRYLKDDIWKIVNFFFCVFVCVCVHMCDCICVCVCVCIQVIF